jgi:hypothetical protein
MSTKRIKLFNLAFLFIFLLISLFINFFHTEKTTKGNDNCPACHFQNSSLTTSQINFFHMPQLYLLDILKTFESFNYWQIFFLDPTSRSPPQI